MARSSPTSCTPLIDIDAQARSFVRSQVEPLANAASILGHVAKDVKPVTARAKVRLAAQLAEQARDLLAGVLQS